jgi:hypothetical protein
MIGDAHDPFADLAAGDDLANGIRKFSFLLVFINRIYPVYEPIAVAWSEGNIKYGR